jgi:hypothetical protein
VAVDLPNSQFAEIIPEELATGAPVTQCRSSPLTIHWLSDVLFAAQNLDNKINEFTRGVTRSKGPFHSDSLQLRLKIQRMGVKPHRMEV